MTMILTKRQIKLDRIKRNKSKNAHRKGRKSELELLIAEQYKDQNKDYKHQTIGLRHP